MQMIFLGDDTVRATVVIMISLTMSEKILIISAWKYLITSYR